MERGDGVAESFRPAVILRVPRARRRDWLLAVNALGIVGIKAPEVDQLTRRIDLRLKRRLALPQHRGAVDHRAPARREQIGGLEKDRRALRQTPGRPFLPRRAGRPAAPASP